MKSEAKGQARGRLEIWRIYRDEDKSWYRVDNSRLGKLYARLMGRPRLTKEKQNG